MTLIITAKAKSHAIVTADGRIATITDGIRTKTGDTLQKVFPLPNRGFAIAHHGENIIEGCKIKEIVEQFLNDKIKITTVRQIAQDFTKRYDDDIRKTLTRISDSKLCGFLFIGFGMVINKSKIYEAFWQKQSASDIVNKIEERGDLVLSGDAKKYITKYLDDPKEKKMRQEKVIKGKIQDTQAYCDRLYKFAEDAQTKASEDIFGGHKHQLVIMKSGCEWLTPPKK